MGRTDHVVSKKNKALCFCGDYCNFIAIAKLHLKLKPYMDKCINLLGEATVFTTLDDNAEYLQIIIKNANRKERHLRPSNAFYNFCAKDSSIATRPTHFDGS